MPNGRYTNEALYEQITAIKDDTKETKETQSQILNRLRKLEIRFAMYGMGGGGVAGGLIVILMKFFGL